MFVPQQEVSMYQLNENKLFNILRPFQNLSLEKGRVNKITVFVIEKNRIWEFEFILPGYFLTKRQNLLYIKYDKYLWFQQVK